MALPALCSPPGPGRLHLLSDGFFYAGRVPELSSRRPSVLLYWSIDGGEFRVDAPGAQVQAAAVQVAPGVRKHLRAGDRPLVCLDLAPTHPAYRALAASPLPLQALPHARFRPLAGQLRSFVEGRLDGAQADRLVQRWVGLALGPGASAGLPDARVRRVMALLRAQPDRACRELAAAVNLSEAWLQLLFQREAGIPLRRYRQVLKLQAAGACLRRDLCLGEVAAIAGFADLPHFSKAWKQHYGVAPQRLFAGPGRRALEAAMGPPGARPAAALVSSP